MSVKTLTEVLGDALENLGKEDFHRFERRLLDRRAEPRVRRNRVEDKSRLEVAEVMVNTFTEAEAWRVAAEVLKNIGCVGDAEDLEKEAMKISPGPGSAAGRCPGSVQGSGSGSGSGQQASASAPALFCLSAPHFVDQHQSELIKRVTNVEPILDQLLDRKVLQQECYDQIRALSTHQAQMRELFSGPLQAGRGAKDVFYEILKEQEKFLVEELTQER
ncbi:apoptosis-associated speck-like protein containing a CARD isoform X1 [Salarias fasciatus]|uniref:apoptosis-associated speck-like protein containing a CARD isoform X1 n=1 Tax=Salarias fasciatus TaxID=181472 RepID=UPI0011765A8A|nr:apoptosis-associated speck-like protein containing a CARD isoform X1 [Salarias fasciatus]